MKKSRLYFKRILLVIATIGGVYLAWHLLPIIFNPMRRPAPMIRNHILRQTPIGMDIDEVIAIIENNERWGVPSVNRNFGFSHPNPVGSPWDYNGRVGFLIIGVMRIEARPARYNVPLWHERNVRIWWGFDEDGKLIEVYVCSTFPPRLV